MTPRPTPFAVDFLRRNTLAGTLRLCYKTAGGVDGTNLMDYDYARLMERMFPLRGQIL